MAWFRRKWVKVPPAGGSIGSNACTRRWLLRSAKSDRVLRGNLDVPAPAGRKLCGVDG